MLGSTWSEAFQRGGQDGKEATHSGADQHCTAGREAEVGLARGTSVKLISRDLGITEQTYYWWRREYGVKSRVVCKSERKLLDASVRLPWRPPWARGVRGPGNGARSRPQ